MPKTTIEPFDTRFEDATAELPPAVVAPQAAGPASSPAPETHAAADEPVVPDAAESATTPLGDPDVTAARTKTSASVLAWLGAHVPGHEHAFLGGCAGLVVALLVFAIGFLRTLLVVVLVFAGVAAGQMLDGDPKIVNALRDLLDTNNS